ncbi:hypothetical protein M422DRAFT_252007 [Sphaerobolus stellatus SS14]|uniref:Heme haloperoxidase family profile domain-containing protein n=1 Tax=Sphaerobolus stellatus (strain SS14) TaxID=990650 RepID=A0A0C9VZY9_SPHS4|nr:hypothetical protein M422DRAFT_252007 [Sphaerobolus stellatus SS14]
MAKFAALLSFLLVANTALAFPQYGSLVGLSERELEEILPKLNVVRPQPPPGALNDNSTKLINDAAHRSVKPDKDDIRGACPGLNALANRGILGVVQEVSTWNPIWPSSLRAEFIVDGNPLTGLFSLGGKTPLTGPNPPQPAIVGGLNTHALFEDDASTTRADAFFSDNHNFNETQLDGLVAFANKFQQIQESIVHNPNFSFVSPRVIRAYAEMAFLLIFFVDGRKADLHLPLDIARGFLQDDHMPDGFFRTIQSAGFTVIGSDVKQIFAAHPVQPGANQGRVNSYTPDPTSADFFDLC